MMKKILCVFLCICMLFTTEMITFVASAIEALPEVDLTALENAVEAIADLVDNQVTITVNYLYDEDIDAADKVVQNPYVARIETGHDFADNLIPPGELGYRATKYTLIKGPGDGHSWVDGVLKLDFRSLSEDVEINVYYEPIQVNYAVRYFFQNIYDDNYTEETTFYKTKQAITGTEFNNEQLGLTKAEAASAGINLDAFNLLYFIPDKVAADGSTVFECFYDRNYYTVNFELDGGYGVEPFHERYETKIIVPQPKKPGYVFKGWDDITSSEGDNVADTPISTMGTEDKTYRAMWEVITDPNDLPTYTVIYWLNDGHDNYSFLRSDKAKAQAGTLVSASHDGYGTRPAHYLIEYVNGQPHCDTNVAVKGDGSTTVNVYFTMKLYTLRFYYARYSTSGGYQVVGGSSYPFGDSASASSVNLNDAQAAVPALLRNPTSWGKVTAKPQLKSSYINNATLVSKYQLTAGETDSSFDSTYTYYYFEFTAPYLSEIQDVWPVDLFEDVYVGEAHSEHGGNNSNFCPYPKAYFSAWNGQYGVKYNQHSNQTIKGKYSYFDDQLLFDLNKVPNYADETRINFLCFWDNGHNTGWSLPKEFRYNIYVETLSGETGDVNYGGKSYKLLQTFNVYDDSTPGNQTAIAMEGFTYVARNDQSIPLNGRTDVTAIYDVNFYYKRIVDDIYLYFEDGYGTDLTDNPLNTNPKTPGFGAPLTSFVPPVPAKLDTEAYLFAGWYDNAECEGEAFDFETDKMPSKSLTLYAKWILVKHDIHFFDTIENMNAYDKNDPTGPQPLQTFREITHYDVMGSVYKDINGDPLKLPTRIMTLSDGRIIELEFVGWFYMDGDMRRAYDSNNTAITDDFRVFAIWRSNIPQPYEVKFVTFNEQGQKIEIADSIKDYARLGATITFTAKAGKPYNQLYVIGDIDYNVNYFPETQSHSITIVEGENSYEFVYRNASTPIEYVVRVVDENGKEWYRTTKSTFDSVVEERYIPTEDITGMEGYYIPDSFYKKLVISVVWDAVQNKYVGTDANVITFVYTEVPDKVGSYIVRYKMQNLDGTYPTDTYHHDFEEGFVTIPAKANSVSVNIVAPSFSGYQQAKQGTNVKYDVLDAEGNVIESSNTAGNKTHYKNGQLTVTTEGVTLILYYERVKTLGYTVEHRIYGSNTLLQKQEFPKNNTYGATVTAYPVDILGYNCVTGDAPQSKEIVANELQNVIVFLYEPIQYQVQYVAVTFHGNTSLADNEKGGTLSRTQENQPFGAGFQAVAPISKQYYQFVGWYTDPECTVPANAYGTLNGNAFEPDDTKLNPSGINKFYAKFERKTGSLTIHRDYTGVDESQVFVYKITNNVDSITLYVTASVSNPTIRIEGLLQGNYSIEQITDWSWRYTEDIVKTIAITNDEFAITFANTVSNASWLNYNSPFYRNIFGGAVN